MTTVQNDVVNKRFVAVVDGVEAELLYRRLGKRLVLVHTGVPDELGGRGVGGELVGAAIDWAVAEQLVVVPHCPFARAWLQKHPAVAGKVEIDWQSTPA